MQETELRRLADKKRWRRRQGKGLKILEDTFRLLFSPLCSLPAHTTPTTANNHIFHVSEVYPLFSVLLCVVCCPCMLPFFLRRHNEKLLFFTDLNEPQIERSALADNKSYGWLNIIIISHIICSHKVKHFLAFRKP